MRTLTIIHAGPRIVVVDKPAGLLSVPGKPIPGGPDNQDCIAHRVRAAFPAATGPLIVHRLDMETSGLMVLALDPEAHRDLSRQFEQRRIGKRYIAVVPGDIPAGSGRIALPLRADIERRPLQVVDSVRGKEALTVWAVLEREADRTRLSLTPLTGRTHQLRLHLAHPLGLNAPIIGDTLYGGRCAPRLMLHAACLELHSPETGLYERFVSDVPF